ncbi:MAG: PD-(D/E)XK nuclease family protein [Thermaerobacter sp.]|nr:PD-(D/E)XK nuclease family protein [Thermaerobacter sp.]
MKPLHDAALTAVADELAKGPWDGPPVYLIVTDGAALRSEREILRRLEPGGSMRLRVSSPTRAAAALLRALGRPAPELLSSASIRAQIRVRAAAKDMLSSLSLPAQTAAGAEKRLAQTVEEILWHAKTLPEAAGPVLGGDRFRALSSLVAGLSSAGAAQVPESVLYWLAAEALRDAAPPGRVHWAVPSGPPALEALRDALAASGMPFTDWQARWPASPQTALRPGVALEAYICRDLEDEARAAVLHCRDLIRQGTPHDEIAIGCADADAQRPLLRRLLRAARIPADLGGEPTRGQPLTECFGGLLDLAAGGEETDAVLRVVGSGLIPPPGPRRDQLLALLRAQLITAARDLLPPALLSGAADWPGRASLLSHLRHLDAWLRRLGLPQATAHLGEESAAVQDAIWNAFWTLSQAAAAAAGDAPVPREAALRAISDLVLAARPAESPRRGAVRVLPLHGLAGTAYPHLLLLGMTEGAFPHRAGALGLLSPEILLQAERAGVILGRRPDALRATAQGEALAALGAAEKSLWLSAAARDVEGRAQGFSPLAAEISRPLTWAPPQRPGGGIGAALSPEEAGIRIASAIARRREIRIDASDLLPLASAYLAVFGQGPEFSGFTPRRPEEGVGAFPGEIAVTALEQFAACRFRFLGGRLGLGSEQSADAIDPRRRGTLMHRVLAQIEYESLAETDLEDAVRCAVDGAAAADDELHSLRDEAGPRGRALRAEIAGEILRAARMLAAERRASAFRIVGKEVAFGQGKTLGPLEVPLPNGGLAALRGRIDRLEEADGLLRVTDFKVRGQQYFEFTRVFHGIDLQVGAYVLAALRSAVGQGKRAAVAVYWPVRVGVRTPLEAAEPSDEKLWQTYRQRGLYLAIPELLGLLDRSHPDGHSPFHPLSLKQDGSFPKNSPAVPAAIWPALERHIETLLGRLAAGVLAGEADPNPYALGRQTACADCDLLPVCRYEAGIEGYRRLEPVAVEAVRNVEAD